MDEEVQIPRIGSAVIVVHDNKILLGRRNKVNANGLWVLPGGRVDWGQTIAEAAIREAKEETGLDVELIRLVGYKEIINLPGSYHRVVFFHLAETNNPEITVSDDLSEANFFSIEEIKKMQCVESVEWALKEARLWK